jgi:hypothetical protein
MNIITLPSPFGPNKIEYGMIMNLKQMIFCESDYELSMTDVRYIESLLNLNMQLGVRSHPKVNKTALGKVLTSWEIIEGTDLNWD